VNDLRPIFGEGYRNGYRSRRVQAAESELEVEIPQVRQAAETFASKLFPRTPKLLCTEPLQALVIGAFVRGLSMREVEDLYEKAGLGKLPKSTALRMCEELKERFAAFKHRDLYEIRLTAPSTRRSSPSDPTGRRRASSLRGGSPTTANACCLT
jgi:transposase-like protein